MLRVAGSTAAVLLLLLAAALQSGGKGAATYSESSLAAAARTLDGNDADFDDIIAAAMGARRILIGESTHGTDEFYRERARITERLIAERGVRAVAIEAEWAPTHRVNLYVLGLGSDRSAREALSGYVRFPRWVWANQAFSEFVDRLRARNMERSPGDRVGLYGVDIYDLFDAADSVAAYLKTVDVQAARRVRSRYRCFLAYRPNVQAYGEATRGGRASCRDEAQAVLAEMRQRPTPADPAGSERHFAAVAAAASVAGAETYYRTAYSGSLAWNERDRWMADNVESVAAYAANRGAGGAPVVVWAHNSHVGDARASRMANRGEINLGQIMRERHGHAAFLIGQFTHSGRVRAAPEWGAPDRVFEVRPALAGSWSDLFHRVGLPAFSLLLRDKSELASAAGRSMSERAIGVVYRPASERQSHYFEASLGRRFDAILFFDRTKPVAALR